MPVHLFLSAHEQREGVFRTRGLAILVTRAWELVQFACNRQSNLVEISALLLVFPIKTYFF